MNKTKLPHYGKIVIETTPEPNHRLSVMTYEVTDGVRKPLEEIFTGLRRDAVRERNKRCDFWSDFADDVFAGAVPCCRQ